MSSINLQSSGKRYWRSLDELADTPEFREHAEKEFANYNPDEMLQPTRRSMVKLMAASTALAGFGAISGCRRWPKETLAPYNSRPEDQIPGVPEYYASMIEVGGVARPILVTSFDGRPIKIEGNPDHPSSGGKSGLYEQAAVLEMYDPTRSQKVLQGGKKSSLSAFYQHAGGLLGDGSGVVVLSEESNSPALADMRKRFLKAAPNAKWYSWSPVNDDQAKAGSKLSFGQTLRSHLHLDKADVIACFDADILGQDSNALVNARGFAAKRRSVDGDTHQMSRIYSAESSWTVTGTNSDRRLPIRSSDIGHLLTALAHEVGVSGIDHVELKGKAVEFVKLLAADLKGHHGKGVVVVGENQPAAVHDLANRINAKLGNIGETITFTAAPSDELLTSSIAEVSRAANAGEIKTLIMLGGNPVYDAPADVNFEEGLAKVQNSIHLGHFVNETSEKSGWHVPQAHSLECWGDGLAYDGSVVIQQPLIQPLFSGVSAIELIARLIGDQASGHDIVRRTHEGTLRGLKAWRKALHDGYVAGSAAKAVKPDVTGNAKPVAAGAEGEEVVFRSCPAVYDGRFSGNGWLQELPDPITKLTWDNALTISKHDADKAGLKHSQLVTIKVGNFSMAAAVFVMPGQADGSYGISLGYGRTVAGPVGEGNGFNAYQIRTTKGLGFASAKLEVSSRLTETYELVTTQDHHYIDAIGMHGRKNRMGDIFREATLEHFKDHPDFAQHYHLSKAMLKKDEKVPLQLYSDPIDYTKPYQEGGDLPYRWAMSMDLSACTGCNACVIACQAENNIPIVGKKQVSMGREMHWIRIDRYFSGDEKDGFSAVHQPVTCHHCENAPCEQVCPAAATVHDSEGLNAMIYNRCIGTRYCSNNCPYKVRRYNWFDFNVKGPKAPNYTATNLDFPDTQQNKVDPVRKLGFNPEVTVRMRGVMEKCTFCTQRIKAKTIPARNEDRRVKDGEIKPACVQTCPTDAIVFGDLNDPNSEVSKRFENKRSYELLKELNVRARNRYLAKITNPGGAASKSSTQGHTNH